MSDRNPLQPLSPIGVIDQTVESFRAEHNIPGVMLGIIGGTGELENFTKGYGTREVGKEHDTPTEETIFEIGSVTKTFTGTGLAWLASQNLLTPGSTVQGFISDASQGGVTLPVWQGSSGEATIAFQNLADFTPGLPGDQTHTIPGGMRTHEELFAWMNEHPDLLVTEPGTTYSYADAAFEILGSALGYVQGFGYDYGAHLASMLATIFDGTGLSMPDTTVTPSQEQRNRFAHGYLNDRHMPYAPGDWLIVSTMNDMMNWLRYSMGLTSSGLNGLLSTTMSSWFDLGNGASTGFGWFLKPIGSDVTKIYKNGAAEGFNSYIAFLTGSGRTSPIGIVVLTNQKEGKATVLGNQILSFVSEIPVGALSTEEQARESA